MKKSLWFIVSGAIVCSFLYGFWPSEWIPMKWWTPQTVYAQIKDVRHPTVADLNRLQKFLSHGTRAELALLNDMEKRCRSFRLIGGKPDELPEQGMVAVNCEESDRGNCLIVYSSFNKRYPKGLKKLVEHVKNSDFKGHILYRVGGWPNVEEGDLKLAHVPYAFKPCFFREAKRLGFARALWLDASITPVVSLNLIFDQIKEKGYFSMGNGWMVRPFMNSTAAASLGVSLEECTKIPSLSAGLFGIDFSDERAARALESWYLAAKNPHAFFSARSDQNALSIILYRLGMHDQAPIGALAEAGKNIPPNALFIIDRNFVTGSKKP